MGKFTTVARAYEALRSVAPSLSQSQYAILLGQAKAESDFGDAFPTPDGKASSNNWGAIYMPGDLGTITRGDTDGSGKPITVKAAWNSTPEVGAKQFHDLIQNNYAPAIEMASTGDLYRYSEALWRNGPCDWQTGTCKRPAYYVGFPPGHKYGLAPADVKPHSEEDRWYRILSYAKFMSGGIDTVNKAMGWSGNYSINPPDKPFSRASSSSLWMLGLVAIGGVALWNAKKRK
jgi:hypothetical protein